MHTSDVLLDAFGRVRSLVERVLDGADAELLAYRPEPDANPIAWLVWHATRIHDDHGAELAGREQVWLTDGWMERFALPLPAEDTGHGHTSEQVALVQPRDPSDLLDYHAAVDAMVRGYVARVDEDELDRVVDRSWDPPTTAGVRLVSMLGDALQHLGQARYLRGMYERTH